ncbi:putative F-box protein [Helianthus annuus]|nr:putative F-box protein [Helianthus annuus]
MLVLWLHFLLHIKWNFTYTKSLNYNCSFASAGMANTRSMTRKLNKDVSASWSDLDQDLLLLIMMHLGVLDFIAFGDVCKSWRSVAVSNWNKFMVSKQPMYLSISSRLNDKECYLEDYQRRKLKTTIPHSNGTICVGITCGYLIFFEREACDFWLVNPFTKKELCFRDFPFGVTPFQTRFRGILVFSPSMFGWVFVVITHAFADKIAFSLPGEQSEWYYVTTPSIIHDLHFFNGKIYTIDWNSQLCELRLNREPTLTLLNMKNFPWAHNYMLEFLSSSENLFVVDAVGDVLACEADFDEMKWVTSNRTIGAYAVFLSNFKCAAAIRPDTWIHPWTQYQRLNFSDGYDPSKTRRMCLTTNMWYFPHDCLIDTDPG